MKQEKRYIDVLCARRGCVRTSEKRYTKYGGENQGEHNKVKEEEDLKGECGDGENLPKNIVGKFKRKVHREGGNDRPR